MLLGTLLQITSDAVITPPVTPVVHDKPNLFELVVKGGAIMIPIGLLLLIAVFIFIERYFSIRKASRGDEKFMLNIRDYMLNGNMAAAKMLCKNTDTTISRMIEKGISRIGRPIREIEGAIENEGKLEIYKMEKGLPVLNIVAGIAPMLGFLGTIFGVIIIFYDISIQKTFDIDTISGGLYVKMVTSAAGLLVGIVAFICHHYLTIMIDRVINKMQLNAVDFIDLLFEPAEN